MTSPAGSTGTIDPARAAGQGADGRATHGAASRRVTDLVVPALDAIVEGSWISLVYVAVQLGPVHGDAVLGPLAFALAAGIGVAWARWVQRATRRERWAWIGWAFALAVGAAGWLADPAARAALAAAGDGARFATLEAAAATNVGGWLLGLAVLRGATHGTRARDDERVRAMLDRVLLLAIPWAIGLAFAQDVRSAFVAAALVSTLLFVGAALLAVGIGRLESLEASAGVDWRRNRAWVVVVGGAIAAMLAFSVPAAFLVGAPPGAVFDVLWLPVASVAGFLGLIAAAVAAPVLSGLETVLRALPTPAPTPIPSATPPIGPGGGVVGVAEGDPRVGLTIAILVLVAIAIGVVLLVVRPRARRADGGSGSSRPAAPEERAILLPRVRPRAPTLRLRARRRPSPGTAAEAYLALLDDVADDTVLARRPSESPRAHARRLRSLRVFAADGARGGAGEAWAGSAPGSSGTAGRPQADVDLGMITADWAFARQGGRKPLADRMPAARGAAPRGGPPGDGPRRSRGRPPAQGHDLDADLALLVADWELARYAGRTLTAAEDRRGVARWRRLRESVHATTRRTRAVRGDDR